MTDLFRGGQVSPLALATRTRGCQVLRRRPLLAAPPRLLEPVAQRRQPSPAAAAASAALRQLEARSLALRRQGRRDAAERHSWRALLFHGCPRFIQSLALRSALPRLETLLPGSYQGFCSCVSKRFSSVMFISE